MTKEQSIAKLKRQIDLISDLKNQPYSSPDFTKWHRDTEIAIENICGKGTRHVGDFKEISYSPSWYSNQTPDSYFQKVHCDGLETARAVLQSLIDEIDEYWDDAAPESKPDAVSIAQRVCSRFHLVATQLRSRYKNRTTFEVKDEYDVQDLLHALLRLEFDDVRREEWTPSYAGGSSRMDFLIKAERIIIEAKMTRQGLPGREVGNQLLLDIERYRVHPDCGTLICFVYDPAALISNPRGLERDLTKTRDGLSVLTIVAP